MRTLKQVMKDIEDKREERSNIPVIYSAKILVIDGELNKLYQELGHLTYLKFIT